MLEIVDFLRRHLILVIYQHISLYLAFFNSVLVLKPDLFIIFGKGLKKRAKEFFKQRSNTTIKAFSLAQIPGLALESNISSI